MNPPPHLIHSLKLTGLPSTGLQRILAIPQDCRKRKLQRESFTLAWNSKRSNGKHPGSFPFLKDLVLEFQQPLSLRTNPTAWSTMDIVFKIFCVQREKTIHEENSGKKCAALKYKKFDK